MSPRRCKDTRLETKIEKLNVKIRQIKKITYFYVTIGIANIIQNFYGNIKTKAHATTQA
jgi:hypothetical protein